LRHYSKEREEDLAFFDQHIERGLVAKLEGIVGSEFVHMDYGEAIGALERSNEKFEFPVQWSVDPAVGARAVLTEKHAKKPVVVMNYPKGSSLFICGSTTWRDRRSDGCIGAGDR
jgi:asparaginyl-tRNA synthetase